MIDVRQLAYFVAVVEAKSFTAAAEVLHIAQPALSQHLQRLEQEFGQQLLIRHSRGVEPTAAGLRLVEHARVILTSVDTATNEVRKFSDLSASRVRVGLPRSLCDSLAFDLMTTWPHEHPNVTVQIIEQTSNALTEGVVAGRLDVAVTSSPSDNRLVSAEPLLQDQFCAVMPDTGQRGHLGEIRFADLVKQPLILYSPGHTSRQLIDLTAKYSSVPLHIVHEVDSPGLAIKLVEAGVGSTIQPYLAMRDYLRTGKAAVKLIVSPGITRRLHLIRARHRPQTAAEIEVCAAIKAHLRHLANEQREPLATSRHEPPLEIEFATDTEPDTH